MKANKKNKLKAAEAAFLFEVLIASIKLLTESDSITLLHYYLVPCFAAMGFADFASALRFRSTNKFKFIRYIGLGSIFSAGAVFVSLVPDYPAVCSVCTIYGISLLYPRVLAIIYKHKALNTIGNILPILLFILITLTPFTDESDAIITGSLFLIFIMTVQALSRMIVISMSQIRLDILKKIFIKSMASEVFLGLMILIVSFSFVFASIEPAINSYSDGLWYCFAVVTTIGFGDITAVTVIGRILSVILGIYGIIVVSLITSIIINFYNETKDVVMTDESDDDDEEESPAVPEKAPEAAEKSEE